MTLPERGFIWGALAVYAGLVGLNLGRHEMWRDELQAWAIARDSRRPIELIRNMRYEGHPALWHAALYGLSRVTREPAAMQGLHGLVAVATAYVFLSRSPFARLEKALFLLGYFPLYEYAAISRSYVLGVGLLFLICAGWNRPDRRGAAFAALLFLLAQTSVYGVILVLALVAARGVEWWGRRPAASGRRWLLGAAIVAAGVGLSVLQMTEPADSQFGSTWRLHLDLEQLLGALGTVWRSYVPVPSDDVHFRDSNVLDVLRLWGLGPVQALVSAGLFGLGVLLMVRRPAALVLYAVGHAGLVAFFGLVSPGYLRHHGHLYLLLVAGLWIQPGCAERPCPIRWVERAGRWAAARARPMFLALLVIQALVGLGASVVDWRYPFSAGQQAARFIASQGWQDRLLVGDADFTASTVANYLDRPMYYPQADRFGTFMIWDARRVPALWTPEAMLRATRRTMRAQGTRGALLVLNYRLAISRFDDCSIRKVAEFPQAVVPEETFWLYLMDEEP